MQGAGYGDPMPSDKLLRLFIIQAISSFVAHDYDSGLHYLNEIKQSYAEHMMSLNPTLKSLAKEIIQSLDMFTPGASAEAFANANPQQTSSIFSQQQPVEAAPSQVEETSIPQEQTTQPIQSGPTSVTSELQDLLNRRRAKKALRKRET